MKPKEGQTVIATEDCYSRIFTPNQECKVLSTGKEGYYVENHKSSTGRWFVFYSQNWPIKEEKRDCKRIIGVVALVLMVISVLIYKLSR